MPFATSAGIRIYWKAEGEPEQPALVLLSSIGTDLGLWDGCMPSLVPSFRIVRMDTRGHGASDAPVGDYTLKALAVDRTVAAVMEAAGVRRAWIAGVSLGGMVAMQLALDDPSRVLGLMLVCTSAAMDASVWAERIARVREGGTPAIADLAMGRFFSPGFLQARQAAAATVLSGLLATPAEGYAGAGAAIRDMDLARRLDGIAVPTLVVTGAWDTSTPFEPHGRVLAEGIPGAVHAVMDCAHLAPVEDPAGMAAEIKRFCFRDRVREDAGPTRCSRLAW